jgi:RNA polymerase sigma factor (sigma-70 family)
VEDADVSEWLELAESARRGDREAFGKLVRHFQSMAVGYAHSILGDFDLAQDAAQEAFIQAFRDLPTLREAKAFPAWFRRIVFKHCHRLLRGKRVKEVSLDAAGEVVSRGSTPRQAAERGELREKVLESIRHLSEKERTATTLFYIDGYSLAEVGGFLGVPLSTVKKRLYSAREKLRERMMSMVETTLKDSAPGGQFRERVEDAIRVYSAKGPSEDHMQSEWDRRLREETGKILRGGEEGFQIALSLSRSENGKLRRWAAVHFGEFKMPRGKRELLRLMQDPAAVVRRAALRSYAMCIHPGDLPHGAFSIGERAARLARGRAKMLPLLADENVEVRLMAVRAVGAYAALGDSAIDNALQKTLEDPIHKVRHLAAGALRVACPGCKPPKAGG